jgi:glycosyltransferase involved in cell wall biosynthesis
LIKVLYIHQDGLITGSAISLYQMIKGFAPNTVDATVLFFNNGAAVDWFKQEGIKTIVLKSHAFWTTPGPKWNKLGAIQNTRALFPNKNLKAAIAKLKPDVVHINDKAALSGGVESKKLGIPVVQHSRSTYYICNIHLYKHLSARIINSYSSHIISISEDETWLMDKLKTSVIYNSISLTAVNNAITNKINLDKNKIHIGWVGKFTTAKGPWDFLELASRLHQEFPQVHFHMLAKLPTEKAMELINGQITPTKIYLQQLIEKYQLSNCITLHGYRKDFLNVMASFDVMINCNRLGAFGRQAFETLALGVASVATCLTPGKSSVLNNDVALICKEGNKEQLFQATRSLIIDENKRNKMAVAAKKWGNEQFSPEIQSEKILNIYNSIIT